MPLFRFSFDAMGSPNELQIWHDDERRARTLAETAIADVRRIEAKYSRYRADSGSSPGLPPPGRQSERCR